MDVLDKMKEKLNKSLANNIMLYLTNKICNISSDVCIVILLPQKKEIDCREVK